MQIDKEKVKAFMKIHGEPIGMGTMGIGAAMIVTQYPMFMLFITYLGIRRYYTNKERESNDRNINN